jgi:hypothetical protein
VALCSDAPPSRPAKTDIQAERAVSNQPRFSCSTLADLVGSVSVTLGWLPTFGNITMARFPAIMALSAFLCSCTIVQPQRWPAQSGKIILTFDDGPRGDGVSEALLDVLRKHKVPAAFSLIGESVRASPHVVQRIKEEGHDVINHTYSHNRSFFSASALDLEILRADQAIGLALSDPNYCTTLFRPPYGLLHPQSIFLLRPGFVNKHTSLSISMTRALGHVMLSSFWRR